VSDYLTLRPDFSAIAYGEIESKLDAILDHSRQTLKELENITSPTWENFMYPQELMDNELSLFWSPVSHLNSVLNSDELREAYNACLPKLSEFTTEVGQNKALYDLTVALGNGDNYNKLTAAQQKIITNSIRDFKLGGVSLTADDKQRFKVIALRLSEITTRYSENLLDVTNAWEKLVKSEECLAGLPVHAIKAALLRAQEKTKEEKTKDGWLLNLDFPTYYAVMTFADDRALREEIYTAYNTRASELGPHDKKYDNSDLLTEVLVLRAEKAKLLGFDTYADLSVVAKMVESPEQVLSFLDDLAAKSLPAAKADMQELAEFARTQYSIDDLQAWDIGYYSDKLKQARFAISEEDLKPYFPASRAIPGMFAVVGKLFGLNITRLDGISTWHDDVEFYQIRDAAGELRGEFYLDIYARENKRGGAWMDVCVSRMRIDSNIQTPVAYLICNLTPPVGDDPALLTHNEVTTLFHEFGHGLHHMLTRVEYSGVSGINGVEWDAVELPSQFLENWCWEREALDLISGHYQTGERLPDTLLQKAQAAKNFQSAMQMVRQLEFAMFDMRLHHESTVDHVVDVQAVLNDVRAKVAVTPIPEFNRFQHGFSHIFAGGYAAGYFSYKWAEVLSADAFSRFEESGIFDAEAGQSFLHNILEKGGTRDAMDLFVAFRGRRPALDALLRHSGLVA